MNDRFLRACWREPVDRTPVWFMRQAGRSSPAYRALRKDRGMLELARSPELAAMITLLPVRELGVDAAILFSDLLLPLEAMGASVTFEEGRGPRIGPVLSSADGVRSIRPLDAGRDLGFVLEAIRRAREACEVPVLGFAGAPFTLASYLLEGGGSRDFAATKRFLHLHPEPWAELMGLLADGIAGFLRAQVEAGAHAVQLFDSWAGALGPQDYARFAAPYARRVLDDLRDAGVPRIHFGTGTAGFLESFGAAGGDVVGVDWRIELDAAWERIGPGRAIQGNLDPGALLGTRETWRAAAQDVLDRAGGRPGHVFNLGHGVLPETPQEHLRDVARFVHEQTGR